MHIGFDTHLRTYIPAIGRKFILGFAVAIESKHYFIIFEIIFHHFPSTYLLEKVAHTLANTMEIFMVGVHFIVYSH